MCIHSMDLVLLKETVVKDSKMLVGMLQYSSVAVVVGDIVENKSVLGAVVVSAIFELEEFGSLAEDDWRSLDC